MTYHSPTDLSSALALAANGKGKIIAGGTDVYPTQGQGEAPETYLDLTKVIRLSGITHESDGSFRIGATTTWSGINDTHLPPAFDALKQAAKEVGSIQIQNAGTIAGNICNASPAADRVPPLLALDARIEMMSAQRGVRMLPLSEFIQGVRKTALAKDELVSAILIPPLPDGAKAAFEKLGSRRFLVISISMVAAVISCDQNGLICDARVSVGSCSPVAVRLTQLEQDILGKRPREIVVTDKHLTALTPISDVRGRKNYRMDVVGTQCERAIRRACDDAQ